MKLNKAKFCSMRNELFSITYDNNIEDCPPHGHPFYELILFTHGSGQHGINNSNYAFSPGSIALLSPSDTHSWKNDTASLHCCIKLRFSNALYFSRLSELCYLKSLPVTTTLCDADYNTALQLLRMLYQEQQDPSRVNSALFSENLIEQVLILIQRNLSCEALDSSPSYSTTQKILQYLEKHFREQITAKDVARALNYSQKYFSHLFTKEFGVTFQEYLMALRLNYAYTFVRYSDQPIIDICYQSGFRTPSYFSTAFKKKYRQTPRDVRKQSDNIEKDSR